MSGSLLGRQRGGTLAFISCVCTAKVATEALSWPRAPILLAHIYTQFRLSRQSIELNIIEARAIDVRPVVYPYECKAMVPISRACTAKEVIETLSWRALTLLAQIYTILAFGTIV